MRLQNQRRWAEKKNPPSVDPSGLEEMLSILVIPFDLVVVATWIAWLIGAGTITQYTTQLIIVSVVAAMVTTIVSIMMFLSSQKK